MILAIHPSSGTPGEGKRSAGEGLSWLNWRNALTATLSRSTGRGGNASPQSLMSS